MSKVKLNFRIHNPNTEDDTVRYIMQVFVDVGVQKLERAVKETAKNKEYVKQGNA